MRRNLCNWLICHRERERVSHQRQHQNVRKKIKKSSKALVRENEKWNKSKINMSFSSFYSNETEKEREMILTERARSENRDVRNGSWYSR